MTTLLIARHGNTFAKGQTPLRVGARTDLPLVESGKEQAKLLGKYLREKGYVPSCVYCSQLKRSIETATIALEVAEIDAPIVVDSRFNEIDYGPDEGKTEEEVIARVGASALKRWDEEAVVPDGWQVDPNAIIEDWQNFAAEVHQQGSSETTLVVTSNGIARFAPYITGDYDQFRQQHNIKLATGAISSLTEEANYWQVESWNVKPKEYLLAAVE